MFGPLRLDTPPLAPRFGYAPIPSYPLIQYKLVVRPIEQCSQREEAAISREQGGSSRDPRRPTPQRQMRAFLPRPRENTLDTYPLYLLLITPSSLPPPSDPRAEEQSPSPHSAQVDSPPLLARRRRLSILRERGKEEKWRPAVREKVSCQSKRK